ncbi:hypothetical protein AtDm6_2849 [Acetobacter tropicalis]|uniref:Uncharacterized protein n=1 Tax=Acetobacter tropicalis TaxID=104102 RepID=A0A095AWT2_9PROT|nr:hypothetical protein AtDm6_2849 [Acetobacter tropicalis]
MLFMKMDAKPLSEARSVYLIVGPTYVDTWLYPFFRALHLD